MQVTICTEWYCVPTNIQLIMSMEEDVYFYLCLDFFTLHSSQQFYSIQSVYISAVCKICTFCPVQGKATDHLEGGCWYLFVFVFEFLQFWFSQLSKFAQFAEWVHWRCVQNLHTLPCARHPVQGKCARHTVQGNATDHLEGTRLHRACTRAWLANIYIRHAQVANWRVICFWAPSMHRGTSESR